MRWALNDVGAAAAATALTTPITAGEKSAVGRHYHLVESTFKILYTEVY